MLTGLSGCRNFTGNCRDIAKQYPEGSMSWSLTHSSFCQATTVVTSHGSTLPCCTVFVTGSDDSSL